MDNPTPFDLNVAIRRWQKNLATSPAFSADDLEEMASHLRVSVQKLKATGLSDKDAFEIAVRRIGEREPLEREFAKVNMSSPSSFWSLVFWIVSGVYFFGVLCLFTSEIICWRAMLEAREAVRLFMTAGSYHPFWALRSHYQPPPSFAVELSVVLVLVFFLGARLATRSWRGIGALISMLDGSIGAVLSLIWFGIGLTVLPAYRIHFLAKAPMPDYSSEIFLTSVNLAIVLIMVLLSRTALRKTSSANQSARRIQFRSR